jgi:hypothetical protein
MNDEEATFNATLDAIHGRLLLSGWASRIVKRGDDVSVVLTPHGKSRVRALRDLLVELGYGAEDPGIEIEKAVLIEVLFALKA